MSKYVRVAKNIVINVLNNGGDPTSNGIKEALLIQFNDKDNKVLLKHLKALNKIFTKAIKELEENVSTSETKI